MFKEHNYTVIVIIINIEDEKLHYVVFQAEYFCINSGIVYKLLTSVTM